MIKIRKWNLRTEFKSWPRQSLCSLHYDPFTPQRDMAVKDVRLQLGFSTLSIAHHFYLSLFLIP